MKFEALYFRFVEYVNAKYLNYSKALRIKNSALPVVTPFDVNGEK